MRAVFPGSFDPLTVAHLAIADAVRAAGAEQVDLVVSRVALAKEHGGHDSIEGRLAVIATAARERPWLAGRVTEDRLLVDIAAGYDALVVGADKWHQLHDPDFYGGDRARDAALARLPRLLVVPRTGHQLPDGAGLEVLSIDAALGDVSSTAVRAGRLDWRAGGGS